MSVRVARSSERLAALRLLLHDLPENLCERRIEALLALLAQREIPPDGLLVDVVTDQLRGALLAVPSAGRCALVHPPGTDPLDSRVEDRLIESALGWLTRQGCVLAQSLAQPEEIDRHACLVRHGFERVSRLWYLQHTLESVPERPSLTLPCTLIPSSQEPERFARTLQATYEGTLDFPELTGRRAIADILAGHRMGTIHDPERWWLLHDGQDVGVALVGLLADTGEWDLSYLGLVPSARGRGLARAVLTEILHQAAALGIPRVVLAIDERNLPAWRLYRGLGFAPEEGREVYLKFLSAKTDTAMSANAPVL